MLETTARLGKLEAIHGVDKKYLRRVLIIAAVCLFVSVCGAYLACAEHQHNPDSFPRIADFIGLFVCAVVPLGVCSFALWAVFRKGRARVEIYEHGLIHSVGNRIEVCEWSEIKSVLVETSDPKYLLQIEKENGEWIILTEAIEGVREIAGRVDREIACLADE